ncbi:helix-turn-helix transcriptional regulator [Chelatococcus reniformis]|uniref:HTH luxR-type domain-containing protein n=1 Tax=Chelatococcus reniformis TaxID=1494448 RepID=A0A916XJU8_9HYPH|nr:helix-turn-helix transcriptional regulator [Chelatococcus reniformis]GGC79174.1 hypothetical protein GCM10010994_41620 [Chelatococcus reniformis]
MDGEVKPLAMRRLRQHLAALRGAAGLDAAIPELEGIAAAIGAAKTAWAPDLSRPYFDPLMDAFHRRQGWPDEIMRIWWNDHATLKMPFYIRCRFEHLPFVTDLLAPARHGALPPPEQRRATTIVLAMGLTAMITVPVHLPRGQVAMVTWAGGFGADGAAAIVAGAGPELLACGHFFMHVLRRRPGRRGLTSEDLSRLTPREWECLRLTAQGYREREVAELSGVSATTVRFHLDNVVRKLGAANRAHAVALAAQLGMLGPIGA